MRKISLKSLLLLLLVGATLVVQGQQKKQTTKAVPPPQSIDVASPPAGSPNILVIWGDDIGTWNISHNNRGMMGYHTPNIDRIAKEGVSFTDYYAQQSCTAGRAAFIGGSVPVRSGMTKVGLPGAKEGWQKTDITMATVLKSQGYATGQFGKNHQGDLDEHLPTMHGFDEFFGNLYHLNAEEEPENPDYPRDMKLANGKTFLEQFGPRGVIKSKADGKGGQTVENTGPLTKKRMETIDDETVTAAKEFIKRQHAAGKPFFCWWNGTRMHFRTHVKSEHRGLSGQDEYSDGMVEHDMHVGELLKLLDELGIVNNTVVLYSTDNGPHYNTWPDAGTTPFRSEKNSNWEGAYRVPAFVRWPGKFPAGTTLNGIISHEDWLTTFAALAGKPDIKETLLKGAMVNGRVYRNHLDGYNMVDYLSGKTKESPRHEFWYVNDDGQVVAARYLDWKVVFLENRGQAFGVWREPFTELRVPLLFNLRRDPFEKAQHNANTYDDWFLDHPFIIVPIQGLAARGIPENAFINIKNTSLTITADVDVPANASGVILCQGGDFGGWSFYMLDGKPVYTYNWVGLEMFSVTSSQKVGGGKHIIKLDFDYDGGRGAGGTATISVDGNKIGEGRIEKTNGNTFGIDESADVGTDENTPVNPVYANKEKFNGKIIKVIIETFPGKK